jgi:hypothetical protein
MFCKICSATLSDIAAKQVDTMHQTVMNNLDALTSWVEHKKAEQVAGTGMAKTS